MLKTGCLPRTDKNNWSTCTSPVYKTTGGLVFSVESLLDVLVVLFDECCSSNLCREKTVTDFVEYGKHGFVSLF